MHSGKQQSGYQFDLSGGALCLDFANTVSHRHLPQRRAEHLDSYADLVAFADQSKLLPPKLAASLRARANRDPAGARSAFRKSIVLRESLYRAFSAIAAGRHARPADVQQINDFALVALRHRKLAQSERRLSLGMAIQRKRSCSIAYCGRSRSRLPSCLPRKHRAAIRECRAPDCEWLFLDHSRNRSRRWCDMKSCGNRQKARRHYQRAHA